MPQDQRGVCMVSNLLGNMYYGSSIDFLLVIPALDD